MESNVKHNSENFANKTSQTLLETAVGKISFEKNNSTMPIGGMIKLNNVPILLIEQIDNGAENKQSLVVKRYPHPNVIENDDYINYDMYDINPKTVGASLIKTMLDLLEEE